MHRNSPTRNDDNNPLTSAQIEELIARRVADAITQNDAARAARALEEERRNQGKPLPLVKYNSHCSKSYN